MSGDLAPLSLRLVLNLGGDPVTVLGHHDGGRVTDMLCDATSDRATRAQLLRDIEDAERMWARYRTELGEAKYRRLMLEHAWERELLEDPSLIDRVLAAVGDPLVRAEMEMTLDVQRRPHPIEVERLTEPWSCDSCGTWFEDGGAVVTPGWREGQTAQPSAVCDGGDPITYCVACIEAALDEAKAVRRVEVQR